MDEALAVEAGRGRRRARLPDRAPTPNCNAPGPARSSPTSRTSRCSISTPSALRELRAARESSIANRSIDEFRKEVKERLGLDDRGIAAAKPRVVATISRPGFTIRKAVFEVEPGIVIPALDITAAKHSQQSIPVVKIGVNWERDLATDQAIEELVRSSERDRCW